MKTESVAGLELIVADPAQRRPDPPLLFVHGAFAGAWVWAERWLPYFAGRGFRAAAVSLRGHAGSDGHEHLDAFGIRDYVADVAAAAASLDEAPALIGHSMGGYVVQKYLEQYAAPAAVLMSSVPPQGLQASTIHLMSHRPGLMFQLNRLMLGGRIATSALREALFVTDIADDTIRLYAKRMSMESQRAIWDMSAYSLAWPQRWQRPPLLVLGTEEDMLIPGYLVQATARSFDVPAHLFRGFGHGFMLEPGSERIADAVIDWLSGKSA